MTIIIVIYPGTSYQFIWQVNLPDDAPDTLIHSAVRDAVNRFIVERKALEAGKQEV